MTRTFSWIANGDNKCSTTPELSWRAESPKRVSLSGGMSPLVNFKVPPSPGHHQRAPQYLIHFFSLILFQWSQHLPVLHQIDPCINIMNQFKANHEDFLQSLKPKCPFHYCPFFFIHRMVVWYFACTHVQVFFTVLHQVFCFDCPNRTAAFLSSTELAVCNWKSQVTTHQELQWFANSLVVLFGCFLKWGYPHIIHFDRMFHHQPSILWHPPLWKPWPRPSIAPWSRD